MKEPQNALVGRIEAHSEATLRNVKLHRNLAHAVVTALESIFEEQQVASRALDRLFAANPKWGKRDRSFVAETTYEIVRWRRLLEHAADSSGNWALLAAQLTHQGVELPDWEEFTPFDAEAIAQRLQTPGLPRAIQESIPDWLDERGQRDLSDRWAAEIHALNTEAPVVIRANTLKISRDELQLRLQSEEIDTQTIEGLPEALQLQTRRSIAHFPLYKEGFFEFQDAASQLVAPFLRVQLGLKVLDACAGAGGKTLHLAALMGNRGHIVASDVEGEKLGELRRRAWRGGISCIETKLAPDVISHAQRFQRILIDAPCSGTGTLRRQPDLKWRLTPDFLAQIVERQRQILLTYSALLQNDGYLVYATCSILPEENERQIEWFVGQSDFELVEQKVISTAETGFDGFYMTLLKKARSV